MINTETTTTSLSLQMYNLDRKKLVARFHTQMLNYLEKYNIMSNGYFKEILSISRDLTDLNIGSWDIDTTIGVRPARLIKQGTRTMPEFADYILQSYIGYLQSQEKKLAKMDFKQIADLLEKDGSFTKALFSSDAYIDWIVDHLEQLDEHDISMKYIFHEYQQITNPDYFIQRLIIKLPKCNTINGSTISLIASTIAFQYKMRLNSGRTMPATLLILSNQLQCLVSNPVNLNKINNLHALNYDALCKLFELTNINNIKLPLVSILSISPMNISNNANIQLYVNEKEDLQSFIDILCEIAVNNKYANIKSKSFNILKQSEVLFYFSDYKVIVQNQINALRNNFAHVHVIIELADLLTLLLTKASKKE